MVGEFVALEPNKQIVLNVRGRTHPESTQVQITLEPKNSGTQVTLTHAGIGADSVWAQLLPVIERRWENGLECLQAVLETGEDLRVSRARC